MATNERAGWWRRGRAIGMVAVVAVIAMVTVTSWVSGGATTDATVQVATEGDAPPSGPADAPTTSVTTTAADAAASGSRGTSTPIVLGTAADDASPSATSPAPGSGRGPARTGPRSGSPTSIAAPVVGPSPSTPDTTAPSPSTPDTTAPPVTAVLDGLVTVSAVPSKTVVTFDDDVIFDVTYHNGTTEAIHVAAHQCGVKLSTRDPAMNAVMFGDWDRTAAGLLALIDGGQSTDGLSWATAVGHAPTPIPLSQYHLCPPFDLAPGSDHHELVHWAVRAGERTLTGTIYARAQFSWMRTSEEGVFVTAPLIAITLVEDPLRIPSRDAAAAAAVAAIVERNIAPPGLPPEQLRLGGWYHAGVWTFAVYPSYWSPSWVHVDAATAQVIGVQTASAAP